MVEFAPATGGLALWMHHHDLADDAVAPVVATDGHTIFYAASFESLPVAEQAGLIAHEVLHVALRHPQRLLELREQLGDVDTRLFKLCADAIVNASLGHLSWLSLPEPALSLVDASRQERCLANLPRPADGECLARHLQSLGQL